MQAGEVFIDIAARLDKLDAGLNEAARMAVSAVEKAKEEYKQAFIDSLTETAEEGVDSFKEALQEDFANKTSQEAEKAGESAGKAFTTGFSSTAQAIQTSVGTSMQSAANTSGNAFVSAFVGRVKRSWTESAGAEQLAANFAKQLGPMAAAKAADGLANFLRSDKTMGEALNDALLSIPFVGSFVNLGTAIYEVTFGAADKAAEEFKKKQDAARDSLLKVTGVKQKEANEDAKRRADLMHENQRLDLEQQVADIRAQGNEKATTLAEYQARAEQLRRDLALRMANDISSEEKKLLEEQHARKIQLLENELDLKLQSIDEQAKAEEEANALREEQRLDQIQMAADAADFAADQAEMELEYRQKISGADEETIRKETAARAAKQIDMERERALASARSQEEIDAINRRFDAEKKLAELEAQVKDDKIEQQKAEQQAQRSGESAATALGQFVFDPYPATKQREVQERIMKATEKSASAAQTAQGFS